jgi:hypothetical protein
MLSSECPLPSALVSVPETSCPVSFGQISKVILQQIQDTASVTATTALLKATWTPFLAATDSTKCVLSPLINSFVIPASELISEGGNDNTTINGIRNVKTLGSVTITGQILNITSATKKAMQSLFPFSKSPCPGSTLLWAYFLTSDNKLIGKLNGTNLEGFPVYNVALSDPGSEGFGKDNIHNFSMDMEGGWSDGMTILELTDIKTLTFKNPS